MFYLYKLLDPITNDVKYVGYSKNPKKRIWEHIRDAKKGVKTYKSDWIRSLLSLEIEPVMLIIESFQDHEKVKMEEIRIISKLRDLGYKLTNLTNGGDGQNGVKLRSDHPIKTCNIGREKSLETRMKLSKALTGKKLSSEHRSNISKSKIGKKRSIESIESQIFTISQPIKVTTVELEVLYFDKVSDAVKFTGVNSNQINKLIKLNKKSKKGFLFEKIIHELSI